MTPVPVARSTWERRYVSTEQTLDSMRGIPALRIVRRYW